MPRVLRLLNEYNSSIDGNSIEIITSASGSVIKNVFLFLKTKQKAVSNTKHIKEERPSRKKAIIVDAMGRTSGNFL